MTLTDNEGIIYSLVEIQTRNFDVQELKDSPMKLTSYKDGWNDPNEKTIQRTYKGIVIGDKFYGYQIKK